LRESTVIRAGFGISYTPFPDNSYAYNFPVRANNSFNPAVASFGPAVLPSGQIATFETGFPALIQPSIPSNGIITNPTVGSAYFVVNHNFKNPYVESWNWRSSIPCPGTSCSIWLTLEITALIPS